MQQRFGNLKIRATRPAQAQRGHRRRGYTLVELLLVVAILTIVAAAVTPVVLGRMSEYRLKDAVQQVRKALAATRIHSIDMSSTYQFRFEPGGRHYLAVPIDSDVVNSSAQSGSRSAAASSTTLPGSAVEVGEIPEDFTFQTVSTGGTQPTSPMTTSPFSATPITAMAATPAGSDPYWSAAVSHVHSPGASALSWSLPIVFQPDGTATDAALAIVDVHGAGYQLSVRELTGEIFQQDLVTKAP